ncbi:hypothetical protein G6L41_022760 [Agrobacterium tumefaciens]|uniref:hypothetical protein n=1 Tax=Agrobacterium tumefaciens TaxID=358 RepID=UPI001F32BFD3|nr:hypothetical protein [Agrobacterium tumefaciens]WCK16384.1 hypothetical protein G6L41_022760 [Agrobacterium tumefaciens]
MCAAVYRQVDQSLPQGISGRFHAPDLRRTDWQALADDIGLSGASTLKRVEELAKLVSNACDEVTPYIVPHSIATIQEVWDQQVKVSGRAGEPLFEPHYETFSFGTIVFRAPANGHYAVLHADGEA